MVDVRYIILSDLHFGATNSVLTPLIEKAAGDNDTGFTVDTDGQSPVLTGLVESLRHLTRDQDRRPTLILAGDVLDLALSPDEVAATVFSGFARTAFGDDPVFDDVVHYLPGNHDHHLWETARENQYVAYASKLPPDEPLSAPWHTTKLEPASGLPETGSAWLTALIQRQSRAGDVEVRVSYPNLGLRVEGNDRVVVISHGHFTESIYTLMTQIKDILYPHQRGDRPNDISVWEEENFAWIDFFWSTLGRSGEVGADVGLIYADLTNPARLDVLVSNLTTAMLSKGKGPKLLHPVEHYMLNAIFRREVNHATRTERGTSTAPLSPQGRSGLTAYLEGPLRLQMEREWGSLPHDLTFVYGHTHKPFVNRWSFSGFPEPVKLFNTGGWVVDSAHPAPFQAGVAVLVSDDLDVAAVEFYRQNTVNKATPVCVMAPPNGASPSVWHRELEAQIDPAAEPFSSLSQAAARLVAQRQRLQAATTSLRSPATTPTPVTDSMD